MSLVLGPNTAPQKYFGFQCGIFFRVWKNRDNSRMIGTEVVTSHRKILFHVISTIILYRARRCVIPKHSFLLIALQEQCRAVPFLYGNELRQQNYLPLELGTKSLPYLSNCICKWACWLKPTINLESEDGSYWRYSVVHYRKRILFRVSIYYLSNSLESHSVKSRLSNN